MSNMREEGVGTFSPIPGLSTSQQAGQYLTGGMLELPLSEYVEI